MTRTPNVQPYDIHANDTGKKARRGTWESMERGKGKGNDII